MKLQKFISNFDNIRISSVNDNAKLLDFYNEFVMKSGSYRIRFNRGNDFFKYLNYLGREHYVFINEDDDGIIEGMGSLSIRPCYINGKKEHVGYLSDGRFKKRRKSKFSWRDFINGLCTYGKNIGDINNCRFFLGSIVDESLIVSKKVDGQMINTYGLSPIAHYRMISIPGHKPSFPFGKAKTDPEIKISRAENSDINDLRNFLDTQNRERLFGYIFSGKDNELDRRFNTWDNFNINSFFVARDTKGGIIGCAAPWDPSTGRKIIIDNLPGHLKFLSFSTRIFGKKVPRPGSELKIMYMTHFETSHTLGADFKFRVFKNLLDSVIESGILKDYHMLSFCDYGKDQYLKSIEKDYFTHKVPATLYQFYSPDTETVLNEDTIKTTPCHEICLA